MKSKRTQKEWTRRAETRLKKILHLASETAKLRRRGPKIEWSVTVHLIGNSAMAKLNHSYREKNYATDVLSFPTLSPFRESGILGELVLCLPVLKSQAKSLEHSADLELDVLLVHGVLHLLGFDHEIGKREAAEMARWETYLLTELLGPRRKGELGLIVRSGSGNEKE